MSSRCENNSPAIRFLNRGQQLARLQGRLINQMMADTTTEHEEVKATTITAKTDMKQFVRETMQRLDKSGDRFADMELMFQLFFCRHVDNFQIFVEELINDAARHNPTLVEQINLRKSDAKLSPTEQLEKRIKKLSFMSLTELVETLQTDMKFNLFTTTEAAERVAYLYDLRNLMTHNYGVVDEHFLRKHPSGHLTVGTRIPLEPTFIRDAFNDLTAAAGDIQKRAQDRFGLFYRTTVREPHWWEI